MPNRKVFLTEVIDPQGQSLTFTYDASVRLVALTDAVGQVTTLDYLDAGDPLRLTRVTDPFGRTAELTYDGSGNLQSITDAIGMTSSFAYASDGFMQLMTTPYGTTMFRNGDTSGASGFRRVEAIDPEGGTERVEFHLTDTAGQAATASSSEVPTGFTSANTALDLQNSLYWNKQAMAEAPGDVARAVVTRWLWKSEAAYDVHAMSRRIPHSIKRPLERRTWYAYPDQPNPITAGNGTGPTLVARVLQDGSTQVTQHTYNAQGMVTSTTDPVGRQTIFVYAGNGIDLLEVRQTKPGGYDTVASYGSYTALHLPGTSTDAAGQTTTTTYNAAGQPLTVTNAKSETTTYAYNTDGQIETVTGPLSGAVSTYTYDELGRLASVEDADGYAVTTEYDALNRVIRRTYPDETFEAMTYTRLDLVATRDRQGRITRQTYDRAGRLTSTRDPLGRVIRQEWCACGTLQALVDAKGQRTAWTRDALGRVVTETRADGSTETTYTYDATGRLWTVTDPKAQVTTHTYLADDRLSITVYTNATIATPSVAFTYDAVYPRVATMSDGIGTTTYAYKAAGALGAGQVSSVDGPLANDVLTYTYDELGRVATRAIDGANNTVTWTYDALGRVTSEANVLGTFGYTYEGSSGRLATVSYPNGQTSAYSYLDVEHDLRLQTIHHKYPNLATLSKFDYTYDIVGNILTWRQQADSTAVQWAYGYDAADQLTSAVKWSTGGTPAILQRFAYAYDPAGNRTTEQIDDAVTVTTHDVLNRLQTQSAGGLLTFAGTLNEPALVTVDGRPAVVDPTNAFRGAAVVSSGTSTTTVVARDFSGNQTSQQYQASQTATGKTFTYDANGNMTSDGTRTFEWDARNQLMTVIAGNHVTRFSYDGFYRRTRTLEYEDEVLQSDDDAIWCTTGICELRGDGVYAPAKLFQYGSQSNGDNVMRTTDHLGSTRDISNDSGAVIARHSYDPWGRRVTTGSLGLDLRTFGGHVALSSDVVIAQFRGYDTSVGQWLSQDPIGLRGGVNMMGFVANNPVRFTDPLGLQISCSSSVSYEFNFAKPTSCGNWGGCTTPWPKAAAKPCEFSMDGCGGFRFEGTIDLKIVVEFAVDPALPSSDSPGMTLWQHEALHIADLVAWCNKANERFKSEGFTSKASCDAGRRQFLSSMIPFFNEGSRDSSNRQDSK